MSATTVSVPKYRHHKGSGQAFVQVKGHRHYLGKWDSPKSKEAYASKGDKSTETGEIGREAEAPQRRDARGQTGEIEQGARKRQPGSVGTVSVVFGAVGGGVAVLLAVAWVVSAARRKKERRPGKP